MKQENWSESFINEIEKKYPKRTQLVQALKDLLGIEREAVYRRLRNEVPFPASEIIAISTAWNISMDKIIGIRSEQIPFHMRPVNYLNPTQQELVFLRQIIDAINALQEYPDTEFMDVCNKLPRQLLAGYTHLNRFYLFKWKYQYGRQDKPTPLSQTDISEEQSQLTLDYYKAIKNVPLSNFIFDYRMFDYLANDINYFFDIQMITVKEKKLIKKDLYDMLDYLAVVANNGSYPETQNRVNLYISRLNIDTNYSYVCAQQAKIAFVHVFDKYELYTFDSKTVEDIKTWLQLKKSTTFQITEVDKKSRIEYFSKQRQVIDNI